MNNSRRKFLKYTGLAAILPVTYVGYNAYTSLVRKDFSDAITYILDDFFKGRISNKEVYNEFALGMENMTLKRRLLLTAFDINKPIWPMLRSISYIDKRYTAMQQNLVRMFVLSTDYLRVQKATPGETVEVRYLGFNFIVEFPCQNPFVQYG